MPPPFLEQFQQVSFFHLHTYVHSICTIFILPCPLPLLLPPTGTNLPAPGRTEVFIMAVGKYYTAKNRIMDVGRRAVLEDGIVGKMVALVKRQSAPTSDSH
jgi:hypothetical protein